MKSMNYDTDISMILKLVSNSGMILSSLSQELKVAGSTISGWKSGKRTPSSPSPVLYALKKRAKFLSTVDLNKHTLAQIKKISGVSFESISEEMDISKQALDQFVDENWQSKAGQVRKKQCQEVLRAMGRRINSALK